MKYLLIHDTRSAGFLSAVVLFRVLTRKSHSINVKFGHDSTKHANQFWESTAPGIKSKDYDQIILCCITFDESKPDACKQRIDNLRGVNGELPLILTHRWPDGYEKVGLDLEILVPPLDLLDRYPSDIDQADRELLRLSLVISRQADPKLVAQADIDRAEALSYMLSRDPKSYWDQLTKDPAQVLKSLDASSIQPHDLSTFASLDDVRDGCHLYKLAKNIRGHAEKTIEQCLKEDDCHQSTIGIGLLDLESDGYRAYLVRAWNSEYPSIEWLLRKYAEDHRIPAADEWYGPQDAKSLVLTRIGLGKEDIPRLKQDLIEFADAHCTEKHGQRRPVANLSRILFQTATSALQSIDLTGKYTRGANASVKFECQKTRILMDRSNRTDKPRLTLVLQLLATTPEGAVFLFQNGGYNIQKLERLVEGTTHGLNSVRSAWMAAISVPTRLRIDVHFDEGVTDALPETLTRKHEVISIPLPNALEASMLTHSSCIARFLTKVSGQEQASLLLYCESETIGPSVQYAAIVGALTKVLGTERGDSLWVLDLFSGSGLSARATLRNQNNWRVICVDKAVSAKNAGLYTFDNITWLKSDFREVLREHEGVLHPNPKCDLVCMDPPHGHLLELLFKPDDSDETVFARLQKIADWLVVYVGHVAHSGRERAIQSVVRKSFSESVTWQLGPELIIMAGPKTFHDRGFKDIVEEMKIVLKQVSTPYGWELGIRGREA